MGWPMNKTLLGCPLYIEDGNQDDVYTVLTGNTQITSASTLTEMESIYSYLGSDYGVDDHDSFCAKINWSVGSMGLAGIGLWEISQAYPPTGAPVSSIWNLIGGGDSCVTVGGPTATATSTATNSPTRTSTNTVTKTSTLTKLKLPPTHPLPNPRIAIPKHPLIPAPRPLP